MAAKVGRPPVRTPIRAGQELIAAFTPPSTPPPSDPSQTLAQMLLVLFDVDGTLLLSHDPLVGEAMSQVARELGVEVDVSLLGPGETALRQGRELGVPDLARWCARVGKRYVDLL